MHLSRKALSSGDDGNPLEFRKERDNLKSGQGTIASKKRGEADYLDMSTTTIGNIAPARKPRRGLALQPLGQMTALHL
jgi:hypothetical protein